MPVLLYRAYNARTEPWKIVLAGMLWGAMTGTGWYQQLRYLILVLVCGGRQNP